MSIEQTRRTCKSCNCKVLAQRQKPNNVLHLLLTVLTCVWGIIWLWAMTFPKPWRCTQCGDKV